MTNPKTAGYILFADQPDASGRVFTAEALKQMAEKFNPLDLRRN
jgi:hypothetical protein